MSFFPALQNGIGRIRVKKIILLSLFSFTTRSDTWVYMYLEVLCGKQITFARY